MLMTDCGSPTATETANDSVVFDDVNRMFDFGQIAKGKGFRARTYKVCWCQPDADHDFNCDSATEFRASFAEVTLLCPPREVDVDGDGTCERCEAMVQIAGGPQGMQCVVAATLLALAGAWFFLGMLLFGTCTFSFRIGRRRIGGVLQGAPRQIEDVSQVSGKVMVTVTGFHGLRLYSDKQSIPVILSGTAHFRLDSNASKTIQFRVRPVTPQSLQLLDATGEPLDFRADTSMGRMHISFPRAFLHSTIPGVKQIPLFSIMLWTLAGWVVCCWQLQPSSWEMSVYTVVQLLVAVFVTLCWRFCFRPTSTIAKKLRAFSAEIHSRNPHPKACPKGPGRAIAVRDVLDLHETFIAFIKDRNMYYIDPNIIRPLTSRVKLSYAEFVGPQNVQWFVSHWWGTEFQVYCEALQRHAKAQIASGETGWEATTYWICTFSNNQYQILEELGTSHKESSFYLALHSGICRGTCMILDEMAMPLARSWCLFELLQTIGLEQKQVGFKGLLFCTNNGVLNYGASTVEMSMKIGERLAGLSLKDAEASTEKDKNMITELVLQEMESFEKIDFVLREHITEALDACHKTVNHDFRALFRKLGTRLVEDSIDLADATNALEAAAAPAGNRL